MVRRDVIFAALAAVLVVTYIYGWSALAPAIGFPAAASSPTPRPTRPAEQTGVARLPGTLAFVLRGDVYVLRDGRYAPLTSEGRNAQPYLSADGNMLYFARHEEVDGKRVVDGQITNAQLGYSSIIRKPTTGGTEETVINGLRQRSASGQHLVSWFLGPALAPDGKRLAVMEDDGDGGADLEVVTLPPTATGKASVLLVSQGADLADAAWSPDGKQIATTTYNTDEPGILLWAADRAGNAQRIAGLPDGDAYRPAYSPDGKWILYTLRHKGLNDVHAYELATKRDVALTSDGHSWNGVLSPDGKWLAFLRERAGTIDLYAMDVGDAFSGGPAKEAVKLTRGEGIDGGSRPSWGR
jgi:Tol biopolymer transport system component